MLQVVDEIDDAVSVIWLCVVGLAAEIGMLSLGAALKLHLLQVRAAR